MSAFPKTVCVDVDGVLAKYDGWKGISHIGEPLPGAREFLTELRKQGYLVVIHTTRTALSTNYDEVVKLVDLRRAAQSEVLGRPASPANEMDYASLCEVIVRRWLEQHELPYDDIWCGRGKPIAVAYVDDRSVTCMPQVRGEAAFADALHEVTSLTH